MTKPLAQALCALAIVIAAAPSPAAASDSLTRLPLYPGIQYAGANAQNVCGTPVHVATYSNGHGDLATLDRWYASHLPGFKILHGTTRNYPYDIFVNSDSTMSVSILGSGPNKGVEAVVYHRNPRPASLSNLTNWLDGGDAICR